MTKNVLQIKRTLTETELCERLTVSARTLQSWRQQGKPPKFLKIGRSIRYPLSAIEDFESNSLKSSTFEG